MLVPTNTTKAVNKPVFIRHCNALLGEKVKGIRKT